MSRYRVILLMSRTILALKSYDQTFECDKTRSKSGAYFIGPSGFAHVIVHAGGETFLSIATHRVGSHGDNPGMVIQAYSPTNFCSRSIPVHLVRIIDYLVFMVTLRFRR
jgi:hypothetical protein